MAQNQTDVKLKLLIDTKGKRVLFGEADKNLIDFLFNLLSLPLGTVIKLLKKQTMVGSLGNLYDSVETLNDTYLQSKQIKNTLLNPKVSSCGSTMLLPSVDASAAATTFYGCSYTGYGHSCRVYVSDGPNAICPQCNQKMTQVSTYVQPPSGSTKAVGDKGGYVKDVVTYMVMDDLTVKPMSTISSITLLNKFNIKELGALEEKIITMDVNQGVKLLKASLQSNTVLTDVFLKKLIT